MERDKWLHKMRRRAVSGRNRAVYDRLEAGESGTALAKEYGLSRQRIYQIHQFVRLHLRGNNG